MRKADDPCISVCGFDGRTGHLPRLQEVRAWPKTTLFRRLALGRELARWVRKLADSDE